MGKEEGNEKSRVRGFFAMGDQTIYWEGWDDPEQAQYDIKRMLRVLQEERRR